MTRILFVLSNAGDQPGGISKYVEMLCRNALNEQNGYSISFLADGQLNRDRLDFYRNLSNGNVITVTHKKKNRLKNYQELRHYFRENKNYFDFVYFNLGGLHYIPSFYLCSRYCNSKIIVHSHSAGNPNQRSILRKWLHLINRNHVTDRADIQFACSNSAGIYLFGGFGSRFTVIPNAIDYEMFRFKEDKRKSVREMYSIDNNTYVLGSTGNFNPIKNHKFMLEVFCRVKKLLPDTVLLLVGSGPLEHEMRNYAEHLGIASSVIFTGHRNDVDYFLCAMDCYLFPSFREGLGISCIEAQCAGCKCLISEGVPREVRILDSTTRIPLNDIEAWVNEVVESSECSIDRETAYETVNKAGFNAKNACNIVINKLI